MRIRDIPLAEIRAGRNWRLTSEQEPEWPDQPLEDWQIEPALTLRAEDSVVYSGVYVVDEPSFIVTPIVLVKELKGLDYGGDYCELVHGRWGQIGLVPNPTAPAGTEYIADPRADDPSFDSPDHDYREWHRSGFRRYSLHLSR